MNDYLIQGDTLSDIASAIRAKTGKTAVMTPLEMPSEIESIQTGAGVSRNDVNFLDYDGTVLYSYTLEDIQTLTDLPALPSHDGLICQGWNWSLNDIKALNRSVDVGAMYITEDGKTRLYISIATDARKQLPLCWSQTVANGVTIDWGDGSETETFDGTGNLNTTHNYAASGDYVITLDPQIGCILSLGFAGYCVLGSINESNRVYSKLLKKAEIGDGASIGTNAFYGCYALASISIPNGVTSIGGSAFRSCYALASISIPNGVTSIGSSAFYDCYALASISIPDGVTSIGTSTFYGCYALASIIIPNGVTSIGINAFRSCYSLSIIIIPNGVTSIGDYAFYGCYGVVAYILQPKTPPSLSGSNVFGGIPSDCIMYVLVGYLETYKTASYWSDHADQMVESTSI